jgi:hypothetical protein
LAREPGYISCPSWGPSSLEIAYYSVKAELLASGAYELKLIRLSEAGDPWVTTRVAPASAPTGLTSSRTSPPSWSPEGGRLWFMANYEGNGRNRAYSYVVNKDGTGLTRVRGGYWRSDGNTLLLARRISMEARDYVLSRYDLSSCELIDVDLPFPISPRAHNGQWHPDGVLFAYLDDDNWVTVVDVVARQQHKVLDGNGLDVDLFTPLSWVRPKSMQPVRQTLLGLFGLSGAPGQRPA